jgi:hypothetical protein
MNIEKQVVSLELSKQLKEAGYLQEGVWWWATQSQPTGQMVEDTQYLCLAKDRGCKFPMCVAPTVAELGEKIKTTSLPLPAWSKKEFWFCVVNGMPRMNSNTEANARAKMWLYLKKEKLL